MIKELIVINYLVEEINEQLERVNYFEQHGYEAYFNKHLEYGTPSKQLIYDNCKKIRQIALKLAKSV